MHFVLKNLSASGELCPPDPLFEPTLLNFLDLKLKSLAFMLSHIIVAPKRLKFKVT